MRKLRRPMLFAGVLLIAAVSGVCSAQARARVSRRMEELERRLRALESAFPAHVDHAKELLGGQP